LKELVRPYLTIRKDVMLATRQWATALRLTVLIQFAGIKGQRRTA
jgi:hypothetical protein